MKTVAIIGAGTMGNGIAHVFAQYGYSVNLCDLSQAGLDRGLATIQKNMERQVSKGLLSEADRDAALKRIAGFTELIPAVSEADLVVEAAVEKVDVKLKLFADLDAAAPEHCILATNTSSISITRIAAATKRPEKVIGMHFMNPVPVMKLVEIICGYRTSKDTLNQVVEYTHQLEKTAVPCEDYPGFVANRILMPMINEAIIALHEGVAGVQEIDEIMKLGMAHPMGPLQLADFIGLDVCLSIMNVLCEGLGNTKYAPCPLLVNMVTAGHLGVKSGEGFYNYANGSKAAVVAARFV